MTKIINKEFLQSRSYESEIVKEMNKKNFYSILKKKGFDPESFLFIKKFTTKLRRQFNSGLRRSYKKANIPMHEAILLIEEDYSQMNNIMRLLDERNKQIIREECIEKFKIHDDDTILFEILF